MLIAGAPIMFVHLAFLLGHIRTLIVHKNVFAEV
nr:MAG TPA: hypothetical protein [Caudoviricetes sp.]